MQISGQSRVRTVKIARWRAWQRTAVRAVGGAVLIAAGAALIGEIRYGLPYALLAIAQGERVVVRPEVVRLRESRPGERKEIQLTVFNLSGVPAR
ncbi:MAG: hypothetical protein ACREJM_04815, partial [Candidatus Saccharimonadales bacterium]